MSSENSESVTTFCYLMNRKIDFLRVINCFSQFNQKDSVATN